MSDVREIRMEDYSYDLPDERIAKYPLPKRDESKLLLYKGGSISTNVFKELPELLPADTLLVFNNTKVIQARLHFKKESGGVVEVFCLDPIEPSEHQLSFSATGRCVWRCMIGRLKLWKSGALHKQCVIDGKLITLSAVKLNSAGMVHNVEFSWNGDNVSFAEILDSLGELPIPPYLNRKSEESDKSTYQTVYSKIKGSVAAPTAGLHFTEQVLKDLDAKGIGRAELTLHVGAGTFYPVKSDEIGGHDMHTEVIAVPLDTIKRIRESIGHVIAVGTTSVRTLESLYFMGCRLLKGNKEMFVSQWEPYSEEYNVSAEDALDAIMAYLQKNNMDMLHGSTQIIIVPGYKLHIVKGLVTNFHQPKSTLLLLISAFVGSEWRKIYKFAMDNGYRFLSYGDSSLIINN
ncbi:MAG: S-adenosylmethionine:tRNA ribosyltransferase-isomerase [Paludibacteraceae bacterium]|nr:S-adenosylmethionine:tRNA ribosyltransferase-isomerase [Paludibacteraceae bacterium]